MGRDYYAYELSDAKLLVAGSPSIVEIDVLYANQIAALAG